MKRKLFLPREFLPTHEENKMTHEGDLIAARRFFLEENPANLRFLLFKRYEWMNEFVEDAKNVIEIGSGAGFSRFFLRNKNLILTDFMNSNEWIEQEVDALNMPFEDNSLDAIISSHMIHHLATPHTFFKEISRVLRPGGRMIIQELNTSFMLRLMLFIKKHEGWSYDVDVFSKNSICNRKDDPWSANCAIPELLFDDEEMFHTNICDFKIIRNKLCEFSIFPLSGGVIAKSKTINLPKFVLKIFDLVDRVLIGLCPKIFACGRSVVLEKR